MGANHEIDLCPYDFVAYLYTTLNDPVTDWLWDGAY